MTYIEFTVDCKHFAPYDEHVILNARSKRRASNAKLEVYDRNNNLAHDGVLDVSYGLAGLEWDGICNQLGGENVILATADKSPYVLKINATLTGDELSEPSDFAESSSSFSLTVSCPQPVRGGNYATNQTVKVLLHSMEILRGPWDPTDTTPDRGSPRWICRQLNLWNHNAGPEVNRDNASVARAKTRFLLNTKVFYENARNLTTNQEVTALAAGEGRKKGFCYMYDPNDDSFLHRMVYSAGPYEIGEGENLATYYATRAYRLYVETIFYQEDFANNVNELRDQYAHANCAKDACEAARVNRPLIPMQVRIFIKSKNGAKAWQPHAVGAVRIDWKVLEPAEDVTRLPANDNTTSSFARKYVTKVKTNLNLNNNNDQANNCPTGQGGVSGAANTWQDMFWQANNGGYDPYVLAADNGASVVYVRAHTGDEHRSLLGTAGVLFRGSLIAGDRYRVVAAVNYEGNNDQVQDNGAISVQTNVIEIWRSMKIGAVVQWPARNALNQTMWGRVRQEYGYAYHDLDVASIPTVTPDSVLTNDDYDSWLGPTIQGISGVYENTGNCFVRTIDRRGVIRLVNNVGAIDRWDAILINMRMALFSTERRHNRTGSFLFNQVALDKLRRRYPSGALVIDFNLYAVNPPEENALFNEAPCLGAEDGLVMIWQRVGGFLWYIMSHEIGHCLWLRHWENAENDINRALDHDQDDHNCMMSYPVDLNGEPQDDNFPQHQLMNAYAPHFCGKCNLKLRGWSVRNVLPNDSS